MSLFHSSESYIVSYLLDLSYKSNVLTMFVASRVSTAVTPLSTVIFPAVMLHLLPFLQGYV